MTSQPEVADLRRGQLTRRKAMGPSSRGDKMASRFSPNISRRPQTGFELHSCRNAGTLTRSSFTSDVPIALLR
jgi:hypothetical protein